MNLDTYNLWSVSWASVLYKTPSQGCTQLFSTKEGSLGFCWPCFLFGWIHGMCLAQHRNELIHEILISPKWEPRILVEECGLPRPELRERLLQGSQEWFLKKYHHWPGREGGWEEKERSNFSSYGKQPFPSSQRKYSFSPWAWVRQRCGDAEGPISCLS